MKNKKIALFIVVLVSLVILIFALNFDVKKIRFPFPTLTPSPDMSAVSPAETPFVKTNKYPDIPIYYENDDQIWQLNPRTEIKKRIAIGTMPAISPDKARVAYLLQRENKYFKPELVSSTGIHLFDIKSGQDILIKHYEDDWFHRVSWSPDGQYLLVDVGTYVIFEKFVINATTKQKINHFTTCSDFCSFFWLDDARIIYGEPQRIIGEGPWGEGQSLGITILNLTNGDGKTLKSATNLKKYILKKVLPDGKIYFSSEEVKSDTDWSDKSKIKITYWTMNQDGQNLQPSGEIKEEVENLANRIIALLPYPLQKEYADRKSYDYPFIWCDSALKDDENWVVWIMRKKDTTQLLGEIFIMNLNNPDSIKEIGKGRWLTW